MTIDLDAAITKARHFAHLIQQFQDDKGEWHSVYCGDLLEQLQRDLAASEEARAVLYKFAWECVVNPGHTQGCLCGGLECERRRLALAAASSAPHVLADRIAALEDENEALRIGLRAYADRIHILQPISNREGRWVTDDDGEHARQVIAEIPRRKDRIDELTKRVAELEATLSATLSGVNVRRQPDLIYNHPFVDNGFMNGLCGKCGTNHR
jgi:hypothetical protein